MILKRKSHCLITVIKEIENIFLVKLKKKKTFQRDGKLPLDDILRRWGYFVPSRCWCCASPEKESMSHVFFKSYAATRVVWSYFFSFARLSLEGLNLHQAVVKCWTVQVIPRLKPIFQALPCIIVWELWKRRNSYTHGDDVTISRVIYQISSTIQSLVKVRKPGIQ